MKKKRKKHPPSIIRQEPGTCWLCTELGTYNGQHRYLEEHHAFPGNPGRQISEANGLKVMLCLAHHREGTEAVHNNADNMRRIQRAAQAAYEKTHTREQWMELLGRNYLEEDKSEEKRGNEPGIRFFTKIPDPDGGR